MKRIDGKCSWEWVKDVFHGGYKVKCDPEYIWEYRRRNFISDFEFCPNCGRRIEFVNKDAK